MSTTKFLNINGYLLDLSSPKVMGIVNVTPDSFFAGSRTEEERDLRRRITELISQGVDILDVGGCSTRPGYIAPSPEEEWERVDRGCKAIRETSSEIPLSIDTFRADIAKKAVEKWGASIINDVSEGIDPQMWPTVANLKVAYVLTHNPAETESQNTEDPTAALITRLSKKANEILRLGVNDLIIDPGFGFGKNIEENFAIFAELEEISRMGWPVLVGVSRKSMIYKTLDITPETSLEGTVALNAWALQKGASILRVHDVKAAKETVILYDKIREQRNKVCRQA